ncbi:MAG: metallopeptidase family protein [Solirubrobacteraceae bacterium]
MRAPPTTGRILATAVAALLSGLGVLTLINGFSSDGGVRALQLLAVMVLGASIVISAIVLALVYLANWRSPRSEQDFEEVVQRAERLAAGGSWGLADDESDSDDEDPDDLPQLWPGELIDEERFKLLVKSAVDELPLEFHRALEHVAIVISDGGSRVRTGFGRRGAYGLYQGDTIVQDYFHERIVIFRDTLTRDFGHDPELLREQVRRTVRHELAHHLGWNERGVSDLGL